MNEENKQITIMECSASYSLSDEIGQIRAKGDAHIKLEEKIFPSFQSLANLCFSL